MFHSVRIGKWLGARVVGVDGLGLATWLAAPD